MPVNGIRLKKSAAALIAAGVVSAAAAAGPIMALTDPTTVVPTGSDTGITTSVSRSSGATDYDWEGLLFDVPSGAVVKRGCRVVENHIPSIIPDWGGGIKSGITVEDVTDTISPPSDTDANGNLLVPAGTPVYRLTAAGTGSYWTHVLTTLEDPRLGMWVRSVTGTDGFKLTFGNPIESGVLTATTTWQEFSFRTTSANNGYNGIQADGVAAFDLYVCAPSLEETAGHSNTNPSEFVSKGVVLDSIIETQISASDWAAQGSNTVEDNGDYVRITYVDSADGAILDLGALFPQMEADTSTTWVVQCRAVMNTGTANVIFANETPIITSKSVSATRTTLSFEINYDGTGNLGIQMSDLGAGEIMDIYVYAIGKLSGGMSHLGATDEGGIKYFGYANGNTVSSNIVTHGIGDDINSSLSGVDASVLNKNGSGPMGTILQGAATNHVTHSNDFSNAAWVKDAKVTLTANQATAPDGKNEAWLMSENETTTARRTMYTATIAASTGANCGGIFAKDKDLGFIAVQITLSNTTDRYTVVVDLSDGSVTSSDNIGATAGVGVSVEGFPNGWYRIMPTGTSTGGQAYMAIALSNSGTPTFDAFGYPEYAGTGSAGVYIWEAQYEPDTLLSRPIRTSGTVASRTADTHAYTLGTVITFPATVVMEVACPAGLDITSASKYLTAIDDGAAVPASDNIMGIRIDTSEQLEGYVNNADPAGDGMAASGSTTMADNAVQVALTLSEDDGALYVDQTSEATDSTVDVPGTNYSRVYFGGLGTAVDAEMDGVAITSFRLYNSVRTTAQLTEIDV